MRRRAISNEASLGDFLAAAKPQRAAVTAVQADVRVGHMTCGQRWDRLSGRAAGPMVPRNQETKASHVFSTDPRRRPDDFL